eukprot:scaffold70535_cov31-Phaeocystis_antarctica.AAC.1
MLARAAVQRLPRLLRRPKPRCYHRRTDVETSHHEYKLTSPVSTVVPLSAAAQSLARGGGDTTAVALPLQRRAALRRGPA